MESSFTAPAEFEFSEEQNAVIKSLSSAMRWVGAVLLVVGALQCVAGLITIGRQGLPTLVQGAILLIFAVFTYNAAYAFRRVVDSAGHDITNLMTALGSLRNLYRLQVVIMAVVAFLLIVSFGLVAIGSAGR